MERGQVPTQASAGPGIEALGPVSDYSTPPTVVSSPACASSGALALLALATTLPGVPAPAPFALPAVEDATNTNFVPQPQAALLRDDPPPAVALTAAVAPAPRAAKMPRKSKARARGSEEVSDGAASPAAPEVGGDGSGCASCNEVTSTLWRIGPDGVRLCNSCGIRWRKYRVACPSCKFVPRKLAHVKINIRHECPRCRQEFTATRAEI